MKRQPLGVLEWLILADSLGCRGVWRHGGRIVTGWTSKALEAAHGKRLARHVRDTALGRRLLPMLRPAPPYICDRLGLT